MVGLPGSVEDLKPKFDAAVDVMVEQLRLAGAAGAMAVLECAMALEITRGHDEFGLLASAIAPLHTLRTAVSFAQMSEPTPAPPKKGAT